MNDVIGQCMTGGQITVSWTAKSKNESLLKIVFDQFNASLLIKRIHFIYFCTVV